MKLEIFRGVKWTLLFRLFDRGLGLISTLLLARLLVPADFGLIAMATSVIAVIELFTAFGFELMLIQRPNPQRVHYDSAWTLNLVTSCASASLVALLAWPVSDFYGDARLVGVMLALAGSTLVGGLENIGTVDFRRQMNFQGEFRFMASKRLASFVVTLVVALATGSYWALLAGTIVGRAAGVVLSYVMQPYRPRLSFGAAGEIIRFSGWTLLSNALVAGIQRSPHFAIGRQSGPSELGLFVLAMDLGTMPTTELAAPVNRSAMAGYSRIAGDPESFRNVFLDVGAMVAMVALPAGIGLAVFAEPLILLLLGTNWMAVAPLLQVLALSGIFVALASNNGVACIAMGRPELNTWMHGIRLACLLALMAVLAPMFGTAGIAYAELAGAAIGYMASCAFGFARVGVSWREVARRSWRVVVSTALTALAVRTALSAWPPLDGAAAAMGQLALIVPLALLGHVAITGLLWNASGRPAGSETQVLGVVRGFAQKHFRAGTSS